MNDGSENVITILTEIRDDIRRGNFFAEKTANNTRRTAANTGALREDVRKIRLGDTGTETHEDPLDANHRRQVDEVKRRYRAAKAKNPHHSLLSVSRQVRREERAKGRPGIYASDLALNSRASREIKREDDGLAPF